MKKTITRPLTVFPFLVGTVLYPWMLQASVLPGKTLFEKTCIKCHLPGPESFKATISDIKNTLRSNTVRQHRFTLTNDEIDQLLEYFTSSGKEPTY